MEEKPKFRRPTLADLKDPESLRPDSPIRTHIEQNKKFKRPTLPPPEKKEIPFEGGHQLEIEKPFGFGKTTINLSGPEARFFAGAGARMHDIKDRAQQIAGVEGAQKRIDERRIIDAPLLETTEGAFGHMAPDVLGLGPLTGPRILSPAGSAFIGALQGASQPLTSHESANNASFVNTGIGMLGGLGAYGVGDTVAKLTGKAIHGLRREPVWADPEKRRLYELGQKEGIPFTIGDLDPFSKWHSAENLLENLPSGRKQVLVGQQDKMQSKIQNVRAQHGADKVDDAGAKIAKGIQDEYKVKRGVASDLFKEVDRIAENTPNLEKIKPLNTHQTAQEIAAEYPDLFGEFKNNSFMKRVLGLERDTGPQPGLILNPRTNKPFKYDQELEFKDAQYLRKRLGAWYADLNKKFEKGTLSNAGNDAVAKAARLLKAIDDDLDAWASQGGAPQALKEKWDIARGYFRDEVMPYRDPQMLASKSPLIRNTINENVDVATLPDKTLPKRETSIASDVMDLSTPEGQEAMRAALLAKITDESVVHRPKGFDTHSIKQNADEYGNTIDPVLTPEQKGQVATLSDLSGLTSRADNILRGDLSYGERLPAYLMGGTAMLGLPSMAYMGLSGFGPESLTSGEKFALAMTLSPLAALAGSRGANKWTTSRFGKNFHFVDPELTGPLGYLQNLERSIPRAAGAPLATEFERQHLGWRNLPGKEAPQVREEE